jgi:hypothetical protein
MSLRLSFNKYLKGHGSVGILVIGKDEDSDFCIEFSFFKWIAYLTLEGNK